MVSGTDHQSTKPFICQMFLPQSKRVGFIPEPTDTHSGAEVLGVMSIRKQSRDEKDGPSVHVPVSLCGFTITMHVVTKKGADDLDLPSALVSLKSLGINNI